MRIGARPPIIGGCIAALCLAAGAPSASALTIGQLAPVPVPACETPPIDLLQPTVTSGNPYVVPSVGGVSAWTVTAWSTHASNAPAPQTMALKAFRKVADPTTFMVVGHEPAHDLVPGFNTFESNLHVKAGDVLGANATGGGACVFDAPGDTVLFLFGNLADGASAPFDTSDDDRVNLSAEITQTSDFTIKKPKSKNNGTAVLKVSVPNPGVLTASGGGAAKSAPGATSAKQVNAAGTVKLKIKAKGLKKRQLSRKGKVTVNPKISFTPTGGIPQSQFRKIKLHRR
jgi:hypothetical protein